MILAEAEALVARVLEPWSLDQFFATLDASAVEHRGGADHARATLLGAQADRTVLDAFATHAHRISFHAEGASAPPPAVVPAAGPAAFAAMIRAFHERGYTVRVPEVAAFAPELHRFTRALELLLCRPVEVSLFWSQAGARAPVHHDYRDNLVIQLTGNKRWRISTETPSLHNDWPGLAEPQPVLHAPRMVDLSGGDLLYVPRGLPHGVEAITESLHLAVCFTPMTVREGVVAVLDHLSDNHRELRRAMVPRWRDLADASTRARLAATLSPVVRQLLAALETDAFLDAALQRRASRTIVDLPRPARRAAPRPTTAASEVRHHPLAIAQLMTTPDIAEFAQPGEHINVHAGVADSLRFIAATSAFRVGDVPGAIGDDVRVALVDRLIASGFLEPAD